MTKDEWGKLNIDMIIDTNVVLCNGHERCNLIEISSERSVCRRDMGTRRAPLGRGCEGREALSMAQ